MSGINIFIFVAALATVLLSWFPEHVVAQRGFKMVTAPSEKFKLPAFNRKSYYMGEGVVVGKYWTNFVTSGVLSVSDKNQVPFTAGQELKDAQLCYLVVVNIETEEVSWMKFMSDSNEQILVDDFLPVSNSTVAIEWRAARTPRHQDGNQRESGILFFEPSDSNMYVKLNEASHVPLHFSWLNSVPNATFRFSERDDVEIEIPKSELTFSLKSAMPHAGTGVWQEPAIFLVPGNSESEFYCIEESASDVVEVRWYDTAVKEGSTKTIPNAEIEEACGLNKCTYLWPSIDTRHPISTSWFVAKSAIGETFAIGVKHGKIDTTFRLKIDGAFLWHIGSQNGRYLAVTSRGEKPDSRKITLFDSQSREQLDFDEPIVGNSSFSLSGVDDDGRLVFDGAFGGVVVTQKSTSYSYADAFRLNFFDQPE